MDMSDERLVAQFAALGQATRLDVVRLLARAYPDALPAGDIARLVAAVPATLSSHLGLLEAAGLVRSRREGRSIRYQADPDAIAALSAAVPAPKDRGDLGAAARPLSVAFVCTGNSARSIMAEAILTRYGGDRFKATSAGSRPRARIEPEVAALLANLGYDTAALAPKSWQHLSSAPLDLVVTLCDEAAGEPCPTWIGTPLAVHWGIPDPVAVTPSARRAAVREAYRRLSGRITELIAVPFEGLGRAELHAALRRIALFDGATPLARLRAIPASA